MANAACIFHHPFPVVADGKSGSQVRPLKMLRAFEQLGLEVEAVTGYARERESAMRRIRRDLERGRRFDFLYSESHTLPTLLTEPHHAPTHPRLDFSFLRAARGAGVPVGLYYRDIHWRFGQYRHAPLRQRLVSLPLYRYDWRQYRRLVDALFLPSLAMAQHLPTPWPPKRLYALPPGAPEPPERLEPLERAPERLELLYVGGVLPPLYDLQDLFDYLAGVPAKLTLCCREAEWRSACLNYRLPHPEQLEVVHTSGDGLAPYYQRSHASCAVWRASPYMDFALPVKILESLGHLAPVIASAGSEAARFVAENGIGWVVHDEDEFRCLVGGLLQHPEKLAEKRAQLKELLCRHTWRARAQHVTEVMAAYSEPSRKPE